MLDVLSTYSPQRNLSHEVYLCTSFALSLLHTTAIWSTRGSLPCPWGEANTVCKSVRSHLRRLGSLERSLYHLWPKTEVHRIWRRQKVQAALEGHRAHWPLSGTAYMGQGGAHGRAGCLPGSEASPTVEANIASNNSWVGLQGHCKGWADQGHWSTEIQSWLSPNVWARGWGVEWGVHI